MSIPSSVTNSSENRIRKHWLLSTASLLVFYPIALLAFASIMSMRISISEYTFIRLFAGVLAGLTRLWLIWHCAYKKHGTKLLSFWMVVGPLQMIRAIVESLKGPCGAWDIVFVLIETLLFMWWWLFSFKMKTANETIQERLSLRNSEPKQV
jgi:hypothetical protein